MKKNIVSILAYSLLGLSTIMVSCGGDSSSKDSNKVENVASEKAFLRADVSGMTCAVGCAKTIEKMLNETEGVIAAEVNFEKEAAFIEYDKAKVSEADLLKAISEFKDGSYSAKVSDKDCKSDCKKVCCGTKDAKKDAKKAVEEEKNTAVRATGKGVKTINSVEAEKQKNALKAVDAEATKVKATGVKTINSVKAEKQIQDAKADAIQSVNSTLSKSKNNIKATTQKELDKAKEGAQRLKK